MFFGNSLFHFFNFGLRNCFLGIVFFIFKFSEIILDIVDCQFRFRKSESCQFRFWRSQILKSILSFESFEIWFPISFLENLKSIKTFWVPSNHFWFRFRNSSFVFGIRELWDRFWVLDRSEFYFRSAISFLEMLKSVFLKSMFRFEFRKFIQSILGFVNDGFSNRRFRISFVDYGFRF